MRLRKEYIVNEKVEIDKNYLVYMYSCLGHEFIACNLNTGMSDSYGVTEGKYEKVTIGYQDIVMKTLEVLYKNPNSSDIEWITLNVNELSDLTWRKELQHEQIPYQQRVFPILIFCTTHQ